MKTRPSATLFVAVRRSCACARAEGDGKRVRLDCGGARGRLLGKAGATHAVEVGFAPSEEDRRAVDEERPVDDGCVGPEPKGRRSGDLDACGGEDGGVDARETGKRRRGVRCGAIRRACQLVVEVLGPGRVRLDL